MAGPSDVRMTRQREVILDALRGVKAHPSADEVYEMVRQRLPRISLGTVYRNLQLLAESGMIQVIAIGGTQRRYDGNTEKHYHVRCVGCGRVADVPSEGVGQLEQSLRGATDFKIIDHRLEFVGLCPACQAQSRSDEEKGS
jgi:Fur family ferric uptake transcriptional regulator